MSKSVTRLFEQFQPTNYTMAYELYPDEMTFRGSVVITGKKVGRPSQRITFHQKGLDVYAARLRRTDKKGAKDFVVSRINPQKSYDEVRLHCDEMLYPGEYEIRLEFRGNITDPMHGVYPCYFKHNGEDKKLIATQFESHHAREAFPCIDEPEAKATFALTLNTPADGISLSNTPEISSHEQDGRRITSFDVSPRMSTYLLAFVYGEMHGISAKTKDGVTVSSYATVAQQTSHLQFANDEAVAYLDFFNDYFGVPFPLSKFDQVALPDFDSLAMENWGLVTFREVGMLSDPTNRSISGEQLISLVVAHELSHQWFGNLVTMKWWDDLWLNESFASIMENLAPDRLHPDWQQWEEFATSRALGASNRDIYKDVQSVSVEVNHPDEISSLFDPSIVYGKGARVLNMLYDYIGEDTFRAGLKHYFEQFPYKNATRNDLWQAFGAVGKQDIEQLMTPWILKSGMPMLSVKRIDDNTLHLSQERFLLDSEDKESLWPVPLLADVGLPLEILDTREATIAYAGTDLPMFNAHGTGHYVTYYQDEQPRKRLYAKVADRSVDSMERINLLNDMLLLCRHGELSLVEALELVELCGEEPRDAVWTMLVRAISQSQTLTDGDTTVEAQIKQLKAKLSSHWYSKLGWEDQPNDDPNTKHLRTTALALSIAGENPEAIQTALDLYKKAGNAADLPAELRSLIAGVAVRFGDSSAIDQLMDEYATTQNSEIQESIAAALCSTRDEAVAKRLIEWGLAPKTGVVRQQDLAHWFVYLMRNYYTRQLAWDWMVSSWDHLMELFGGGKHMEYFIWYAAGALSTPDWQQKFTEFFEPKLSDVAMARNIKISINEIAARADWRQREEANLKAFYAKIN